jgi:serine/threonine-protein kinase
MEWLAGEDLETRLRIAGRLDRQDTYRIVSQVAQGLARAHAAGIIHRDLKPGNIFLAKDGDTEIAKLLDFGLAKMATAEKTSVATHAGSVLGTPAYMSPEQARSAGEIDHRSDLWSLAVIVYECLLGQLPFDGASLGEVFARLMFEPIPVPSDVDPTVPRAFDAWWAKAASRDVEKRFDGAVEMADALGEALALGESPSSAAPSFAPRTPSPEPSPMAYEAAIRREASDRTPAAPAVSQTVRPPVRRHRRSRWPLALSVAGLALVAAVVVPREVLPSVYVTSNLGPATLAGAQASLRSGLDSVMRSISGVDAPAHASAFPTPVPQALPAPVPSAGAGPVVRTAEKVKARSEAASAALVAATVPTPAAPAPAPSADESKPYASGLECAAQQRRCAGRVLQVCGDDREGWVDVVDCGSGTCDATGAGGCQ